VPSPEEVAARCGGRRAVTPVDELDDARPQRAQVLGNREVDHLSYAALLDMMSIS